MSERPVTGDDVLAVLPAFVRQTDDAPVRDALAAALVAIIQRYRELSDNASAESDITTATGARLDGLCEDRGIIRQRGEKDDELRARTLTAPDVVTPAAILAAADSVLAPYTSIRAQYSESALDRWFVRAAPGPWRAYVGASPTYPSRLYPADVGANEGLVRPQSTVGGARVFVDQVGRHFLLRVPVLAGLGDAHAFVARSRGGSFVGSGASQAEVAGRLGLWAYRAPARALDVYQSIANSVNRIKGHSVRWSLFPDPKLRG